MEVQRDCAGPAAAPDDWSPADNPYAIAVSEAQWWLRTAKLAILRIRDGEEDLRVGFSSRQIDARQLVFALRQLLTAEDLEQRALTDLGLGSTAGATLTLARERFERALPDIKNMRDGLMHVEEWARGTGRGPQRDQRRAGVAERDVARMFWGFRFDPNIGTVFFGPYAIDVEVAERAAGELARAIYLAALEVDRRETAAVRARVVGALDRAGLPHGSPGDVILVSPGQDLQVWLSLSNTDSEPAVGGQVAAQVVVALGTDGLHLISSAEPDAWDVTERLVRGEPLRARAISTP